MKVLHKPEKAPLLGKIRAEFSRKGVLAFFGVSSVLDPEVSIHSAEFNLTVESYYTKCHDHNTFRAKEMKHTRAQGKVAINLPAAQICPPKLLSRNSVASTAHQSLPT